MASDRASVKEIKRLTRDGIVQNKGDRASNKHGSGEENVQHLVNFNDTWER